MIPLRGKSATTAMYARRPIAALQEHGKLSSAELASMLQLTLSGARNYLAMLKRDGLIVLERAQPRRPLLCARIIADAETVAAYCAQLDQYIPRAMEIIEKQRQRLAAKLVDASVHVHLTADDEPWKVKRRAPNPAPARDPFDALFFGAPRGAA